MAFQGVNFASQRLLPSDDGRLYSAIFNDGALHGCTLSYTGAELTLEPGYLIVGGRLISADAEQVFLINEAITGFAQLVLRIDMTQTSTISSFQQVSTLVRYASSEDGFATLQTQDINGSGSIYELQLAKVSLGSGGITGVVADMPKATLKGGGSGSGGLNYNVIGGTSQPSSASENTIWVNTDAEITSHVFSATEPESPAEGMVWFSVSTSCAAPINVLKKGNVLMVYPMSCKQYIGGVWESKTAKTYQNGAWVDWFTYIFKAGEGALVPFSESKEANCTITFNKEAISLQSASSQAAMGAVWTTDAIDLSNRSTLTVDLLYTECLYSTHGLCVIVKPTITSYQDFDYFGEGATAVIKPTISQNRQTCTLDVSDLTGFYRIGFGGLVKVEVYDMALI